MKAVMGSCKEATDWISRQEEGKLGVRKRIQLWIHLRLCEVCRQFQWQSHMLGQAGKKLRGADPLSDEARKRIDDQLFNEKQKESG